MKFEIFQFFFLVESAKLVQLREQHRQKTQQYTRQLEEQRLLLAQIQKLGSNPNNAEQRKGLLFKVKQMDQPMQQLKAELEQLSQQIAELSKGVKQTMSSSLVITVPGARG